MAHLLIINDAAGGAEYSVHVSERHARLALADAVLSGLGSVDHAQVIPVEVEQSLTASVGPQQTAALREALGALPDSALTWDQLLTEVRKLVGLAATTRVDVARRQGDALRKALGVRPDTAFDTLIAEVEFLVDQFQHAQVKNPDA